MRRKANQDFLGLFDIGRIERLSEVITHRREEFLRLYERVLAFSLHGIFCLNAIDYDLFPSSMWLVKKTRNNEEALWMSPQELVHVMLGAYRRDGCATSPSDESSRVHGMPRTEAESRFKSYL